MFKIKGRSIKVNKLIDMQIEFKFDLGQKVTIPSGAEGRVESNSVSLNMTVNRISVEYVDKNGATITQWFDEDRLVAKD